MSNTLNGGWKQLQNDLKNMSTKQKLDHLWTYYKGSLVIVAVAIMLLSIVSTSLINRNTDTLMAGVGVNLAMSEEGKKYIKDDYFELVKTGGLEEIQYSEIYMEDFSKPTSYEESYYTLMSLVALSASEDLDYLLMDQTGMENLLNHGIFLDLREFFTEEELAEFGEDKIVWAAVGEEGKEETVPVAVDISQMPFIRNNTGTNLSVFFGAVVNSPRLEELRDFWTYLNAWTPAE